MFCSHKLKQIRNFYNNVYMLQCWLLIQTGLKLQKNEQQKERATCFKTLLQNELDRDVSRFTTDVRTCLVTNEVARFFS